MTAPRWQGSDRALGPYTIRILWFRVLISGAIGFGLGLAYAAWPADSRPEAPAATEAELIEPAPLPDLQRYRDPAAPKLQKILAARRISLRFESVPLTEAIAFIRSAADINIIIEAEARDAIENEGAAIRMDTPDITVAQAIDLVIGAVPELRTELRRGAVIITAKPNPRITEYYDLRDLFDRRGMSRGATSIRAHELEELIPLIVEDAGSDEVSVSAYPPILVVRGSLEQHRAVARLIRQLREHPERAEPDTEKAEALKRRLDSPVSVRFADTPLTKVLRVFQDRTGLAITPSPDVSLEDATITLQVREMKASEALDFALDSIDLSWTPRDDDLFVYPKGHHASGYQLRVLAVRDLLVDDQGDIEFGCISAEPSAEGGAVILEFGEEEEPEGEGLDPEALTDLLFDDVGEQHWEDPAFMQVHRGQLFVYQTRRGHERLDAALAKMRRVRWRSREPGS